MTALNATEALNAQPQPGTKIVKPSQLGVADLNKPVVIRFHGTETPHVKAYSYHYTGILCGVTDEKNVVRDGKPIPVVGEPGYVVQLRLHGFDETVELSDGHYTVTVHDQ